MLSRARVDVALPLLDTRRACLWTLASTPTHPLLTAQADNILVYTHSPPHFVSKQFALASNPPPPDIPPFVYNCGSIKIYILL